MDNMDKHLEHTEEREASNKTLNKNFNLSTEAYHNVSRDFRWITGATGLSADSPVLSCQMLSIFHPSFHSGYYWLQSGDGNPVQLYCILPYRDFYYYNYYYYHTGMRIATLNKNSSGANCFIGLKQSANNRNSCVVPSDFSTCSSTFFNTFCIPYTHISGSIKACGTGSPDGFRDSHDINDNCVDGISISYGMPPNRQHLYTLAANTNRSCMLNKPSFVSSYYACLRSFNIGTSTCSGSGCKIYFNKQLQILTDQDIEIRVCRDQSRNDEDIIIEEIVLYVR